MKLCFLLLSLFLGCATAKEEAVEAHVFSGYLIKIEEVNRWTVSGFQRNIFQTWQTFDGLTFKVYCPYATPYITDTVGTYSDRIFVR